MKAARTPPSHSRCRRRGREDERRTPSRGGGRGVKDGGGRCPHLRRRQGPHEGRGHHAPHPSAGANPARGHRRRPRRPGQGAHGIGQDPRLPPSHRARAREAAAGRPREPRAAQRDRVPAHQGARRSGASARGAARRGRGFRLRFNRRRRRRKVAARRDSRERAVRHRNPGAHQGVRRPRRHQDGSRHRAGPRRSGPAAGRRVRARRGIRDALARGTGSNHVPQRDDATVARAVPPAAAPARPRRHRHVRQGRR